MLFEVRQHGMAVMGTNYPSCVYDLDTLKSMQKAGCTFRVNGKTCTAKDVGKAVEQAAKQMGVKNSKTAEK